MWESPVYTFKRKIRENGKLRNLVVDVTNSAPTFDEPGKQLEGVFDVLTAGRTPGKTKILDVGAAKLRNTLYLLDKGFILYAVEFEELAKRMPQAKTNWTIAEKYSNFRKLVFPKEFFALKDEVDVILLINVTNVMPVPEERLVLLSLCREKIKKDGSAFWYNWRDPTQFTPRMQVNDGFFKGIGRHSKTFHGEWDREWVYNAMISSGFSHDENTVLPSVGNNQAYVFVADHLPLLGNSLGLQEIMNGGKKHDSKREITETGPLDYLEMYTSELRTISRGRTEQCKFHRISERLLSNIFDHELKNPAIENEINSGRGRIDIRFHNRNQPGFFKNLKEMHDILCPTISVECKNYVGDVRNPEFQQLASRLNNNRGLFGMLICRAVSDPAATVARSKDYLAAPARYMIVLDDGDLTRLARLKKQGNDEVDEFMDRKLDEIID
ncbi:MAG TPA: hypothetical protein VK503_00115 [Candidatus Bathyarchaeia archaeon]|nr:hypothetical protein [Candidatus Bathyarchaeia archaeon]